MLAAGCGSSSPAETDAGCETVFVGDAASAPEIEPVEVQVDGSLRPLLEGDAVTIFTPLPGGKIVLVGALVSNVSLEDCGRLRIGAVLRDPTDPDHVILRSERLVRYAPKEDRPGWAAPIMVNDERAMGPNLEVCGFIPSSRDGDGCEWILEIRLLDAYGSTVASARRTLTPTCPEDDPGDPGIAPELELELCQCQCAANYEVGRCDATDIPDWVDPPPVCE